MAKKAKLSIESPEAKPGQLSPRVHIKRKGLSRAELTVRKTVKGVAVVYGKGSNANTYLGSLLYDRVTGTWKYLVKGRKVPSHLSFRTKTMAAVALGGQL